MGQYGCAARLLQGSAGIAARFRWIEARGSAAGRSASENFATKRRNCAEIGKAGIGVRHTAC
jgi:hypothetical protein